VNEWVRAAAADAVISPEKIKAIMYIESRGNPRAVNPSDPSYGLMQIELGTAKFYGRPDLSAPVLVGDPELNAKIGARFLAHLLEKYGGDFEFGEWAQAYNVGEPKFDRGIRNPLYGAKVRRISDGEMIFLDAGQLEAEFRGTL